MLKITLRISVLSLIYLLGMLSPFTALASPPLSAFDRKFTLLHDLYIPAMYPGDSDINLYDGSHEGMFLAAGPLILEIFEKGFDPEKPWEVLDTDYYDLTNLQHVLSYFDFAGLYWGAPLVMNQDNFTENMAETLLAPYNMGKNNAGSFRLHSIYFPRHDISVPILNLAGQTIFEDDDLIDLDGYFWRTEENALNKYLLYLGSQVFLLDTQISVSGYLEAEDAAGFTTGGPYVWRREFVLVRSFNENIFELHRINNGGADVEIYELEEVQEEVGELSFCGAGDWTYTGGHLPDSDGEPLVMCQLRPWAEDGCEGVEIDYAGYNCKSFVTSPGAVEYQFGNCPLLPCCGMYLSPDGLRFLYNKTEQACCKDFECSPDGYDECGGTICNPTPSEYWSDPSNCKLTTPGAIPAKVDSLGNAVCDFGNTWDSTYYGDTRDYVMTSSTAKLSCYSYNLDYDCDLNFGPCYSGADTFGPCSDPDCSLCNEYPAHVPRFRPKTLRLKNGYTVSFTYTTPTSTALKTATLKLDGVPKEVITLTYSGDLISKAELSVSSDHNTTLTYENGLLNEVLVGADRTKAHALEYYNLDYTEVGDKTENKMQALTKIKDRNDVTEREWILSDDLLEVWNTETDPPSYVPRTVYSAVRFSPEKLEDETGTLQDIEPGFQITSFENKHLGGDTKFVLPSDPGKEHVTDPGYWYSAIKQVDDKYLWISPGTYGQYLPQGEYASISIDSESRLAKTVDVDGEKYDISWRVVTPKDFPPGLDVCSSKRQSDGKTLEINHTSVGEVQSIVYDGKTETSYAYNKTASGVLQEIITTDAAGVSRNLRLNEDGLPSEIEGPNDEGTRDLTVIDYDNYNRPVGVADSYGTKIINYKSSTDSRIGSTSYSTTDGKVASSAVPTYYSLDPNLPQSVQLTETLSGTNRVSTLSSDIESNNGLLIPSNLKRDGTVLTSTVNSVVGGRLVPVKTCAINETNCTTIAYKDSSAGEEQGFVDYVQDAAGNKISPIYVPQYGGVFSGPGGAQTNDSVGNYTISTSLVDSFGRPEELSVTGNREGVTEKITKTLTYVDKNELTTIQTKIGINGAPETSISDILVDGVGSDKTSYIDTLTGAESEVARDSAGRITARSLLNSQGTVLASDTYSDFTQTGAPQYSTTTLRGAGKQDVTVSATGSKTVKTTDTFGNEITTTYDDSGFPTLVEGPDTKVTYARQFVGANLKVTTTTEAKTSDPALKLPQTVTEQFDTLGRLVEQYQEPAKIRTVPTYDSVKKDLIKQLDVTYENGSPPILKDTYVYSRDSNGNVTSFTLNGIQVSPSAKFDSQGYLTELTDLEGDKYTRKYSPLFGLREVVYPDGKSDKLLAASVQPDGGVQASWQKRLSSNVVTYKSDGLGRPLSFSLATGGGTRTDTYNYNGADLTSISSVASDGVERVANFSLHDSFGRPTSIDQITGDGSDTYQLGYGVSYTEEGLLASNSFPDATKVIYNWNKGKFSDMYVEGGSGSLFKRTWDGPYPKKDEYAGGLAVRDFYYGYSGLPLLSSIKDTKVAGGSLNDITYTYDTKRFQSTGSSRTAGEWYANESLIRNTWGGVTQYVASSDLPGHEVISHNYLTEPDGDLLGTQYPAKDNLNRLKDAFTFNSSVSEFQPSAEQSQIDPRAFDWSLYGLESVQNLLASLDLDYGPLGLGHATKVVNGSYPGTSTTYKNNFSEFPGGGFSHKTITQQCSGDHC